MDTPGPYRAEPASKGGSKWAIKAAYIVQAAKNLGVPLNQVVITYAWGDMMADVIQPFHALDKRHRHMVDLSRIGRRAPGS